MSPSKLVLVRHAEVESRYQRVFGGSVDMDLSPRGLEQAERLADYICHRRLDAIFSSPMKRVQQTLMPLLSRNNTPPVVMQDLREVDFGEWTGHGWDEVQKNFGMRACDWLDHLEGGTIPGGETGAQFQARVEPCLREILLGGSGKTTAVFCHGGVIRMILSILLKWPLSKMRYFEIDYASMTELEVDANGVEIQLLNFTPWRDLPQ